MKIEDKISKEYKNYILKTKTDQIPYENETQEYTENQIAIQKRKLVKEALSFGLKLKAIDQEVKTQSQIQKNLLA